MRSLRLLHPCQPRLSENCSSQTWIQHTCSIFSSICLVGRSHEINGPSFWRVCGRYADLLPHLEREYIRLVSRPDAGEILPLIRKIARRGGDLRAIVARSHDRRTLLSAALLADMGYALDSDVIPYTPHLFQAITGHDVEEACAVHRFGEA